GPTPHEVLPCPWYTGRRRATRGRPPLIIDQRSAVRDQQSEVGFWADFWLLLSDNGIALYRDGYIHAIFPQTRSPLGCSAYSQCMLRLWSQRSGDCARDWYLNLQGTSGPERHGLFFT